MDSRLESHRIMTRDTLSRAETTDTPHGASVDDMVGTSADDPERNIPVRKNGQVTWLTRAEYDEHYRREGR